MANRTGPMGATGFVGPKTTRGSLEIGGDNGFGDVDHEADVIDGPSCVAFGILLRGGQEAAPSRGHRNAASDGVGPLCLSLCTRLGSSCTASAYRFRTGVQQRHSGEWWKLFITRLSRISQGRRAYSDGFDSPDRVARTHLSMISRTSSLLMGLGT